MSCPNDLQGTCFWVFASISFLKWYFLKDKGYSREKIETQGVLVLNWPWNIAFGFLINP